MTRRKLSVSWVEFRVPDRARILRLMMIGNGKLRIINNGMLRLK